MVTQKDIENGLREIGLERGDIVMVHSSLSRFGEVEGGADTVVDAILAVIGPEGTMVVPTFNYNPDPFDPKVTPSLTGAITEAVRHRPDAVRSLHPTHSVAAIGEDVERITGGHEDVDAFGTGSALYNILEMNGKILQLGVTHTSNSMIHVAEEIAQMPYLHVSRSVTIKGPNGQVITKTIRRPGCSRGFNKIEDDLEQTGQLRETMIGKSRVRLMPAATLVAVAVQMLKDDPASLLCDIGDCTVCAEARAVISAIEVAEEDQRLAKEWEEQEKLASQETGEEPEYWGISGMPEEGITNGEDDPD